MSDSMETKEETLSEAERKAREMVAVAEYLCTHAPAAARTTLLLDRLSFNVEQCLADGTKTSLGALVCGRLPLYALVCESPAVVPAEERDALQRTVALATRIGTNAIGRVRAFIRLLLNNRTIVPWLRALSASPTFLEFVSVDSSIPSSSFFSLVASSPKTRTEHTTWTRH